MIKTTLKLSVLAGPAVAAVLALTPAVASAKCVDTDVHHGNVPPLTIHSATGVTCQQASKLAYLVDSYKPGHEYFADARSWFCSGKQQEVPGVEDPIEVETCTVYKHPGERVVLYLGA